MYVRTNNVISYIYPRKHYRLVSVQEYLISCNSREYSTYTYIEIVNRRNTDKGSIVVCAWARVIVMRTTRRGRSITRNNGTLSGRTVRCWARVFVIVRGTDRIVISLIIFAKTFTERTLTDGWGGTRAPPFFRRSNRRYTVQSNYIYVRNRYGRRGCFSPSGIRPRKRPFVYFSKEPPTNADDYRYRDYVYFSV